MGISKMTSLRSLQGRFILQITFNISFMNHLLKICISFMN